MIIMIAVINNSDNSRVFRLYNCNSLEVKDVPEQEIIEGLKSNKIRINNLGLNEDEHLVGTQGAVERYATIGMLAEARYRYPVVVINKTGSGFTVVDCIGCRAEMSEDDLIQYAKKYGVANAKVVTKGKTQFISAISGTFELVGGRLSDDLIEQWRRLQALKQDGKLSEKSVQKLNYIEAEFEDKIQRLRKSELRNKLNGAFNLARAYNLINDIAEIIDEVDIDRVDEIQKKVSKEYKEIKSIWRSKKKNIEKDKRDKLDKAIKFIGKEIKKNIRYIEEEDISSDECVRRFEVIGRHLSKIKANLEK